jgi:hypothetical protein
VSVKNPSYLFNRNGIFYFQYRIPIAIAQQFNIPQKLVCKSFGTGTRANALRKARKLLVIMEDKIDTISKIPVKLKQIREFSIKEAMMKLLKNRKKMAEYRTKKTSFT